MAKLGNKWLGYFFLAISILVWVSFLTYIGRIETWDVDGIVSVIFGSVILIGTAIASWPLGIDKMVAYFKEKHVFTIFMSYVTVKIGMDGLVHFALCAVFTALLRLLMPVWIAWIPMAAISIGKEIYDRKSTGFSWKDLVCDIAGIIVGL